MHKTMPRGVVLRKRKGRPPTPPKGLQRMLFHASTGMRLSWLNDTPQNSYYNTIQAKPSPSGTRRVLQYGSRRG